MAIGGCSSDFDAGSSRDEQLCTVLASSLDGADEPAELRLEPLLEGAATDPADMPSEILPLALAYRTNESSYDDLGPYEPAIEFTAALVELAQDDLVGPSTLSPKVLESALAIDQALEGGACADDG